MLLKQKIEKLLRIVWFNGASTIYERDGYAFLLAFGSVLVISEDEFNYEEFTKLIEELKTEDSRITYDKCRYMLPREMLARIATNNRSAEFNDNMGDNILLSHLVVKDESRKKLPNYKVINQVLQEAGFDV